MRYLACILGVASRLSRACTDFRSRARTPADLIASFNLSVHASYAVVAPLFD